MADAYDAAVVPPVEPIATSASRVGELLDYCRRNPESATASPPSPPVACG
jgi:hypothetical protein